MPPRQPGWEGTMLLFAMVFTVLLGIVYAVAIVLRFAVPWLLILALSILITVGLRFTRRRP